MSNGIVELDGHREPQRRRSDRFVVGTLLSASLAFGIVVALARSTSPSAVGVPPVPTPAPTLMPQVTAAPTFRLQPPIFRPGTPFPRTSFVPLPAPDVWRSGTLP